MTHDALPRTTQRLGVCFGFSAKVSSVLWDAIECLWRWTGVWQVGNSSSRIPSVAAKGQRRQLGVSQMVLDTDIYTAEPSDKALDSRRVQHLDCGIPKEKTKPTHKPLPDHSKSRIIIYMWCSTLLTEQAWTNMRILCSLCIRWLSNAATLLRCHSARSH